MRWIRPTITLIVCLAVTWGFISDKIDAVAYFGLASSIVVWWFKSRDEEKRDG